MSDLNCKYCGSPLGFCPQGEYCTNERCSYIDGHYRGPIEPQSRISKPERMYSQSELDAATQELRQENERLRAGIRDNAQLLTHDRIFHENCAPQCIRCKLESLLAKPEPATGKIHFTFVKPEPRPDTPSLESGLKYERFGRR